MTEEIWNNQQYRELTISWNQAMCSRFENVFSQIRDMDSLTEQDLSDRVFKHSLDLMNKWYQEPSPREGLNNAEFISQIDDLKELISLAATMSVYGEMIVPDLVIRSLEKFGDNSMDALVREIMRADFEACDDESEFDLPDYFDNVTIIMGSSMQDEDKKSEDCAIPACAGKSAAKPAASAGPAESGSDPVADTDLETGAGSAPEPSDGINPVPGEIDYAVCESQASQRIAASFLTMIANSTAAIYIPLIVEKLAATNKPDIVIQEAAAQFLSGASYNSPAWLMEWLNETLISREDLTDHPVIYLVMYAIAKAQHKGDKSGVLTLLLRTFDYMSEKAIGAGCLASFGDPRAMAFLKSWLHLNQNQIDEKTWHEFAMAIRRLGGKIDPAEHPNRFH